MSRLFIAAALIVLGGCATPVATTPGSVYQTKFDAATMFRVRGDGFIEEVKNDVR